MEENGEFSGKQKKGIHGGEMRAKITSQSQELEGSEELNPGSGLEVFFGTACLLGEIESAYYTK